MVNLASALARLYLAFEVVVIVLRRRPRLGQVVEPIEVAVVAESFLSTEGSPARLHREHVVAKPRCR